MLSPERMESAAQAGLYVTLTDGIARCVLRRAGGNRFSHALLEAWAEVMAGLVEVPDLRVVLVSADGPDFSFGADLTDAEIASRVAGTRDDREALATLGQTALDAWATLPVPTLAVGQGRIIGAGACFFTTADFPVATPEALVQFPEVDRGMHLSWGIIPRLVARYGLSHAATLAMLGEPVACERLPRPPIRVEKDPLAAAEALALTLAAKPPLAVRAIKRVLLDSAEQLQVAATKDAQRFADTVGSHDFAEAMGAWFEKRPGRFTGQ